MQTAHVAPHRSLQVCAASSEPPARVPLPEVDTAKEAIELGNQLGKENRCGSMAHPLLFLRDAWHGVKAQISTPWHLHVRVPHE